MKNITAGFELTVRRFPVVTVVSALGTAAGVWLIQSDFNSDWAARSVIALLLCWLLTLAVAIAAEHHTHKHMVLFVGSVAAVALAAGLFWYLPGEFDKWHDIDTARTLLWMGAGIMLVLMAPFVWRRAAKPLSVWKYVLSLFGSIVLAGVFSQLFFAGVAAAIGAVDTLFDVSVPDETWGSAWTLIVGLFATTFFLSRVPTKEELAVGEEVAYLKELKIFSFFVLFPLTVAYFVILYLYAATNLSFTEWPEALISYMIIGFSVVGIVAHAFLYPLIRKRAWVLWFVRLLYVAVIPQVAVLFWSVGVRINAYGWTDNRYFIVLFGLWLLAVAIYFLVDKKKQLLVVPVSLFFVMTIPTLGPWSAFAVSQSSQLDRFESLATEAGLLVDGQTVDSTTETDGNLEKSINSVVNYLVTTHGAQVLSAYTNKDLAVVDGFRYEEPFKVAAVLFGELFPAGYDFPGDSKYFSFYSAERSEPVPIGGYEQMVTFGLYEISKSKEFTLNNVTYKLSANMQSEQLTLTNNDTGVETVMDLHQMLKNLDETYGRNTYTGNFTVADTSLSVEDDSVKLFAVFWGLSGQVEGDRYKLNSVEGDLFLQFK